MIIREGDITASSASVTTVFSARQRLYDGGVNSDKEAREIQWTCIWWGLKKPASASVTQWVGLKENTWTAQCDWEIHPQMPVNASSIGWLEAGCTDQLILGWRWIGGSQMVPPESCSVGSSRREWQIKEIFAIFERTTQAPSAEDCVEIYRTWIKPRITSPRIRWTSLTVVRKHTNGL